MRSWIKEKAELHRLGHRPRRRFQRSQGAGTAFGPLRRSGSRPVGDYRLISVSPAPRRAFRHRSRLRARWPAFAQYQPRSRPDARGLAAVQEVPLAVKDRSRAPRPRHRARDQAPVLWRTGFAGRREVLEWPHVPGLTHLQCRRIVGKSQAGGQSTPGRHLQERSDVQPDYRYLLRRRIADPAGEDLPCRTNCRNGPESAGGCSSLRALLPSAR